MEETYDALIEEANNRIEGLTNQLALVADTTNTIVKVNRVARSVIEIFDDIIEKDKLDKHTLHLIIDRIIIYEDNIEIKLQADVDELLRTGTIEHMKHNEESEVPVNFNPDTENIEISTENYSMVVAQRARNQRDKVFRVNVISDGDPLEIYTDREGEVIFKKYSPIGELTTFAAQYADTLYKTCGIAVLICDRDAVVAVGGVSKKEYLDKALSKALEDIMQGRSLYRYGGKENESKIYPTDEEGNAFVSCAMPIISEGDVIGCALSLCEEGKRRESAEAEVETKLITAAASFLGKQMES